MKLDKEKLKRLGELSDEELWRELSLLAKGYGISLGDRIPTHDELMRVRRIFLGEEKISMREGMKLINKYKNGAEVQ